MSEKVTFDLFSNFKITNHYQARDFVLFLLMYSCGLRISEVLGIQTNDINFEDSSINIRHTKGGGQRFVFLCQSTARVIKVYLTNVRVNFPTQNENIFVSKSGNQLSVINPISIFKNLVRENKDLDQSLTPHCFRKSIGKHMLDRGLGIRYVQQFLGHKSISSTAIYTRLNIEDLKIALKKYHPRSKNGTKLVDKIKFKGGE